MHASWTTRGATLREFILGDGIEDVQTTNEGDIWVSYYDQGTCVGVWSVDESAPAKPFDPAVLSDGSKNEHSGLLRTTPDGRISWRFTATATIEPIFWCNALNVAGDASVAWACYEVFPGLSETCSIVGIRRDGSRRLWHLDQKAGRGLAVYGDTIVIGGGYGDDAGSLTLGRMSESGTVEDVRPVPRIRGEKADRARVIGRGPIAHWIRGTRWYVLDLRD
jgi:hypothetical protein